MPKIERTKPESKKLLVIIPVESGDQAMRNVKVALRCGADGVFLMSHSMISANDLVVIGNEINRENRHAWVGFNFLDLTSTYKAFDLVPDWAKGLWVNDPGIIETEIDPVVCARSTRSYRLDKRNSWKGQYFGSVAFKYQRPVNNPARVAGLAAPFVDVITTSCDATGGPPTVDKIKKMKKAIMRRPLAIASNIASGNVHEYIKFADYLLPAIGMGVSDSELDPDKVRAAAKIIHSQ